MKQICVVGVGYVGIVTGACFADLGATLYLLLKYATAGPAATDGQEPPADAMPSLVGVQD